MAGCCNDSIEFDEDVLCALLARLDDMTATELRTIRFAGTTAGDECAMFNICEAVGPCVQIRDADGVAIVGQGTTADPFVLPAGENPPVVFTTEGDDTGVTQSGENDHTIDITLLGDDVNNLLTLDASNGGLHLDCNDLDACFGAVTPAGTAYPENAANFPIVGVRYQADNTPVPFIAATGEWEVCQPFGTGTLAQNFNFPCAATFGEPINCVNGQLRGQPPHTSLNAGRPAAAVLAADLVNAGNCSPLRAPVQAVMTNPSTCRAMRGIYTPIGTVSWATNNGGVSSATAAVRMGGGTVTSGAGGQPGATDLSGVAIAAGSVNAQNDEFAIPAGGATTLLAGAYLCVNLGQGLSNVYAASISGFAVTV